HRMPAEKESERAHSENIEPQQEDRYQRNSTRKYLVDGMNARSREPVHIFDTVMHSMESPQARHLVKHAMNEIVAEIGDNDDFDNLQRKRLSRHCIANGCWRQGAQDQVCCIEQSRHAGDNDERRQNGVGDVQKKKATKYLLVFVSGQQSFQ